MWRPEFFCGYARQLPDSRELQERRSNSVDYHQPGSLKRGLRMDTKKMGPDISKSALIIVDMQNDFVHPDGALGQRARENPERDIDMPFLMGTIPNVSRLADVFRTSGRPIIYLAHVLKPDYSDAQIPYWRINRSPAAIAPSLSRAPGAPKSWTISNPARANISSSKRASVAFRIPRSIRFFEIWA